MQPLRQLHSLRGESGAPDVLENDMPLVVVEDGHAVIGRLSLGHLPFTVHIPIGRSECLENIRPLLAQDVEQVVRRDNVRLSTLERSVKAE
jgi:hypothetical protein